MEENDKNKTTPGGNRNGNPHVFTRHEARILETSTVMQKEESNKDVLSDDNLSDISETSRNLNVTNRAEKVLLGEISEEEAHMVVDDDNESEGTKAMEAEPKQYLPSTNAAGLTASERKELQELTREKGPNGITYAQAQHKIKLAQRTLERFGENRNLEGKMAIQVDNARKTIGSNDLREYVEQQRSIREKLGYYSHHQNAKKEANPEKGMAAPKATIGTPQERRADYASKRRREDEPVDKRKPKLLRPSTSTEAKRDDLRLVVVDTSNSNGRIDETSLMELEMEIMVEVSKRTPEEPEVFFEAGWMKTHRIYDCQDELSYNYLKDQVNGLKKKNGEIKAIPVQDLASIEQPKGWIWVPKPFVTAQVVLGLLVNQNKDLNSKQWQVIKVGDKKELGQHFLIQFHRDDMVKLEQRHWVVKVGFFNSTIRLEGERLVDKGTSQKNSDGKNSTSKPASR